MNEGITAEDLNIVIGHMPLQEGDVKDKVKAMVLKILNEKVRNG